MWGRAKAEGRKRVGNGGRIGQVWFPLQADGTAPAAQLVKLGRQLINGDRIVPVGQRPAWNVRQTRAKRHRPEEDQRALLAHTSGVRLPAKTRLKLAPGRCLQDVAVWVGVNKRVPGRCR